MSLLNHRSDILSMNGIMPCWSFWIFPWSSGALRDSKKDVDRRLKLICEQFIADTSSSIFELCLELNSRVNTFS